MEYESVIGLEIHVELKTRTKMFCGCLNDPLERHPDVNICPICLGHPGVLPVINLEAVKRVLKAGLALNCRIPEKSKFDRKNYFYPDLPKGYQISQYDQPFCGEGRLEIINLQDPVQNFKVGIRRIHLEEDTGRLVHPEKKDYSLVDFNRAGVPLMELVTEPDIKTGREARRFAEELQLILRYLKISDADMEKGQMRVEANISLRPEGTKEFGTKVEIKNLNSFKAVERAIDYEIKRQGESLDGGKEIIQETRGWDADKERTFSQRTKEEAHDYRYFPEPDLPPLQIGAGELDLEKIRAGIPELPQAQRERFRKEYNLPFGDIEILTASQPMGAYFEKVVSELSQADHEAVQTGANYLISDLQNLLKETAGEISDLRITAENFAEFISLIHGGKISSRAAKEILKIMFKTGADPSQIMDDQNLAQVSDEAELKKWVDDVVKENPGPVEDFKKGKIQALQFLVGKVMQKSKGRGNPQLVVELLQNNLAKS